MITPDQKKWIDHLSDIDTICVVPYDKEVERIFEDVRIKIEKLIGSEYSIEHHGASSLGISGQDEIDVYVPVASRYFDELVLKLTNFLGEPKSHYSYKRARFSFVENGKRIDIFPINQESDDWKRMLTFENFLRENTDVLEQYRILKESGNGLSIREYYRRKIEFINDVLEGDK